jgi:hypothetical protein
VWRARRESNPVYFRTVPVVEALAGPYDWFCRSVVVGHSQRRPGEVASRGFGMLRASSSVRMPGSAGCSCAWRWRTPVEALPPDFVSDAQRAAARRQVAGSFALARNCATRST